MAAVEKNKTGAGQPELSSEEAQHAATLAILDEVRPSLLDKGLEKLATSEIPVLGPGALLTRVLLLARTPIGDKLIELEELLQQCLAEAEAASAGCEVGDTSPTGVMLAYSGVVLFVLEFPTKVMLAFLSALDASVPTANLLSDPKVVSMTGDAPYRAFGSWQTHSMATSGTDVTDFETDDFAIAAASDLNLAMLRLGDQLQGMPLASAATSFSEMPHPGTLRGLVAAEGTPTLGEFLDIFATPVLVDLDSEKAWPGSG